jgi:hypothetical protein
VFARYVAEEMLFSRPFKQQITRKTYFQSYYAYFKEATRDWSRCMDMCTDGVTAMTRKYNGIVAQPKRVASNISWTYCIIHSQALAAKHMPD